MLKQKLYVGVSARKGINGKRVLIVGHQCHASAGDKAKYDGIFNWEEKYLHDHENENENLMEAVKRGFKEENGDYWERRDHISYLRFARIMSGNNTLQKDDVHFKEFWENVAFCNLLQVPDLNLPLRSGRDKSSLYKEGREAMREYIEEFKPGVIIVWGAYAYPHVVRLDSLSRVENYHSRITIFGVGTIDVIKITHPCVAGYESSRKRIREAIEI